jgi:hypothetical protein
MNALALSTLSLISLASGADGSHASDDWQGLDREIEQLQRQLESTQGKTAGPRISGFILTSYERFDDIAGSHIADRDGFQVNKVWLEVNGPAGEGFRYNLGIDALTSQGQFQFRDVEVSFPVVGHVRGTMGKFRPPFLYSATDARSKGLFLHRSVQGSIWNRRDDGFMLNGKVDGVRWFASAQNGGDGADKDLLLVGKLAWAVAGGGIDLKQEGGYGVDAKTRITAGVGVVNEGSIDQGTVLGGEVEGCSGRFFFQGEVVDYGDGFTPNSVRHGAAKHASGSGGTTPYAVALACMLTGKHEAAVRYEDLDDIQRTRKTWFGLNWYVHGHACKWQLDWEHTAGVNEAALLELGVTVAF